jgi:hypothetical protein
MDNNVFDLVIPNVELFGMFQRNRRIIYEWLQKYPDDRNKVIIIVFYVLLLKSFTAKSIFLRGCI